MLEFPLEPIFINNSNYFFARNNREEIDEI